MKIKNFKEINENYALEELTKIYDETPSIKNLIEELNKIDNYSNQAFDYYEERELLKAYKIKSFLKNYK